MAFDHRCIQVCVTLGLSPDDVASLKQLNARDDPSMTAYSNAVWHDKQEPDVCKCLYGAIMGSSTPFTSIYIVTGIASLPAFVASRLRWDQANAGFPTYQAADLKDNKWITYTLRGEAVVEDALELYPELKVRWRALADPRARGLLLWHALTLSIRPGRVDVDGLLRDHAPCDHAIVWLVCAYLHCTSFCADANERRADGRMSPMRRITQSAGVALCNLRTNWTDVLRSGPVPFDVELDLCAAAVHRIARQGIAGEHTPPDRLYRLADAMYLNRELSQEQAFDVFRCVYERNWYDEKPAPVPTDLRGIGAALALAGDGAGGDAGGRRWRPPSMCERLRAAQAACEVRFVAFEDPAEERHELRFCLGHGTDRLLCGTVVATYERVSPDDDDDDMEGVEDDMAWRVRVGLEPARRGNGGEVFRTVVRVVDDATQRPAASNRAEEDSWACDVVLYKRARVPCTVRVRFTQIDDQDFD